MGHAPVFRGRVTDEGRVEITDANDRRRYRRLKDGLRGERIELVLRKARTKRSLDQNAWHWGVAIPMIASEAGYDLHEHDDLHYWLVATCFGVHERDGVQIPNKRSSQLTTAEFSAFMEWTVRWAAQELGVRIPLPDEIDWEAA